MDDHDQQPEKDPSAAETPDRESPYAAISLPVRERLATVALALSITPTTKVPRGGIAGAIFGATKVAPSVTDALRIARFAFDGHRDIKDVDQHETSDGVTAHDLLTHLTRKES